MELLYLSQSIMQLFIYHYFPDHPLVAVPEDHRVDALR